MYTKGIMHKKETAVFPNAATQFKTFIKNKTNNINLLPKLFNQHIFDRRTLASSDTTL